jgi:hypothetical protein
MAAVAQAHSEWHRRMTSEKLNQANRPFDDSQLQAGMRVYFYKSPSQQDVSSKGRKAKHLAHYHGPATVTAMPRRRQLELQYEGKTFNRDISLVIPAMFVCRLFTSVIARLPSSSRTLTEQPTATSRSCNG